MFTNFDTKNVISKSKAPYKHKTGNKTLHLHTRTSSIHTQVHLGYEDDTVTVKTSE
jgi:hypothetical protein